MPYVRNTWYVAAWSRDLDDAKPYAMTVLGERLVLYRTEQGRAIALEDRCVHRLAPLSLGRREGERLRCMYHGILFDPTGSVVDIPGQETIPAQARVRAYPVAERSGWVWVWMGDAQGADEALIPSYVGLGHPDYVLGHAHLDYAAEARLISDNLLDFSHVSYVHAQSFRLGAEFAQTHAKVTQLERGILYERWTENQTTNAASQDDTPADAYLSYKYLLPGVLVMQVAAFAPGTARRMQHGAPDFSEAVRDTLISTQAVTPMDDKTSRYFFIQGIHRKFGGESMRDAMVDVALRAFAEDKTMIEAQQRVINATAHPTVMATSHDRSVVFFNRLVERLAAAEA